MKIYLARNNVQAGPYTLDELDTMLASGEVLLDDLAWHSGMSQWQRLGDLTNNQYRYEPISQATPAKPAVREVKSFGDNPDFQPADETQPKQEQAKRVSVAELYGRKEPTSATAPQAEPIQSPLHRSSSESQAKTQIVYASIGSRFLAVVINFVLFMLALLPFLQGFMSLNPDPAKINTGAFADRMAYAQELVQKLPPDAINITSLLMLGYLIIQLILIIARGQSFGKLVVGIRTVDSKTHELPSFFKRVFLRVVVLFFIYQMVSALPLPINMSLILLMINYFISGRNPQRQGWHDKLAGTVVVKTSSVPFKKK